MSEPFDPWTRLQALFPSFSALSTREDLTSQAAAYAKDGPLVTMQFLTIEVLVLVAAELRVGRELATRQIGQVQGIQEQLAAIAALLGEHAPAQTAALQGIVEHVDAMLASLAPAEDPADDASPTADGDASLLQQPDTSPPGPGDASPANNHDDIDALLLTEDDHHV